MDTRLAFVLNGLLRLPGGELWAWIGTRPATLLYIAAVAVWVLSTGDRRRWLWPMILAVLLADSTVNHVWKPAFERSRPCAVEAQLLTTPPGGPRRCGRDFSFPSGHSASSAAVAAATMSRPLVAISALVGAQRVVTGQHWPSDVLGGWAYGWIIGLLVRRSAVKLEEARARPGGAPPPPSSPGASPRSPGRSR